MNIVPKNYEQYKNRNSNFVFRLRIGISHGEVTAGVVGAQKPLYDIWGDAVNMASRMDTTGIAGKIQVSLTLRLTLTLNEFVQ